MENPYKPLFEMTMGEMLESDYVLHINRPRYTITIYASQFLETVRPEDEDDIFLVMYDLETFKPILIYAESEDKIEVECGSKDFMVGSKSKDGKSITFIRKSYYERMDLDNDTE